MVVEPHTIEYRRPDGPVLWGALYADESRLPSYQAHPNDPIVGEYEVWIDGEHVATVLAPLPARKASS